MTGLRRLILEIHRRSLWQVLVIYLGASWGVLEAADQVVQRFAMPDWVYGGVVLLLLVGLPIVLATAFVQERPERSAPPPADTPLSPRPRADGASRLFTWRNAVLGGVVAFALWGVVAAVWMSSRGGAAGGDKAHPSVAVLPFMTAAVGAEDADFFAGGLHDELLTQLSKISGLSVISRTSVMRYADAQPSIPEIARQLGVSAVVEGGIQRTADRLRVNVQLVDGATDEHLWAETYDRSLTLDNIFDIQGEIARRIAAELRVELTPAELTEIGRRSTENIDAYELYLRGKNQYARRLGASAVEAIDLFAQAGRADPAFAAAHAAEAMARIWSYWNAGDVGQAQPARDALDRARALAPDAVETRLAEGLYLYRVQGDYPAALQVLLAVQDRAPSNAEVVLAVAAVQRRLGHWEEAARMLGRSVELDPSSPSNLLTAGQTQRLMGRLEPSLRYLDRAISLESDNPRPRVEKTWALIGLRGDTAAAQSALEDLSEDDLVRARGGRIQHAPEGDPAYYRRDYEANLQLRQIGGGVNLAVAMWVAGDREEAAALGDSLAGGYLRAMDQGRQAPFYSASLQAFAGLGFAVAGDTTRAVEHGDRALRLIPSEQDAFFGPRLAWTRMITSIILGDYEDALERLEFLVSVPSEAQPGFLRLDPLYDPLRGDPRFEELVRRAEAAVR